MVNAIVGAGQAAHFRLGDSTGAPASLGRDRRRPQAGSLASVAKGRCVLVGQKATSSTPLVESRRAQDDATRAAHRCHARRAPEPRAARIASLVCARRDSIGLPDDPRLIHTGAGDPHCHLPP